ncbi:MAG: HAD-IA family hydrolase [Candidatus Devosia symbiotica]|nr:HAD-IA family hydrolase [Candidatus Devosia symbiotica]
MILVIFDMDGTLIDTQALITEHMAMTFHGLGLEVPSPETSRRVIGLSLPEAMAQLSETDDDVLIGALVEAYRAHYRAGLITDGSREGPFPGALEAVQRLNERDDVLLGIATGNGLAGVHRILALHGVANYFSTLQTPDHNPSKPHPSMVKTAMRETGVGPERTIMIGDTTFDIEMGVAAGCKTIGVTWGYHEPRELIAAGASAMIDRYDQLDGALRQLVEQTHA